jgi:integrase
MRYNVKITKRTVDAQKAGAVRKTIWDSVIRGFGLRTTPAGVKTYVLKYTFKGEQRWFTIGKHGSPWTPETARQEAWQKLDEVRQGIDPQEAKKADRKALTVAQLCDLYVAEGIGHLKASTIKADRGRMERHIKPLLGNKRISDILRGDIERLVADVTSGKTAAAVPHKHGRQVQGGTGAARQCAALLSTIFAFAIDRRLLEGNPCQGVKKPRGRSMQRFLSSVELGRLATALGDYQRRGGNKSAVAAIQLLLLTGARKNEVLSLKWDHVDFERRCLMRGTRLGDVAA